jgi:4-azaleucine resistance transporter AzlC
MDRNSKRAAVLASAFAASIPVLLGYVTIGIAFGLLLVRSGMPWWLAPVMSVVVYAGAAQFMAVGLFAAGTGILEIAALTLFLNARHAVYGLSLLDRFAPFRRHKPYLIYALTDETYGILTTVEPPEGSHKGAFYTAVSALDQSYWVIGSCIGAIVGGLIPFDTTGLDFALTALFIVLLVEQTRSVRQSVPYLVAAFSTAVSLALIGPRNLLIAAIGLSILLILPFKRRLEHA